MPKWPTAEDRDRIEPGWRKREAERVLEVEPPEDADDEWGPPIPWSGGFCPVPASEEVMVRFRPDGRWFRGRAGQWTWYSHGIADIIEYRRRTGPRW